MKTTKHGVVTRAGLILRYIKIVGEFD